MDSVRAWRQKTAVRCCRGAERAEERACPRNIGQGTALTHEHISTYRQAADARRL